MCYKLSPEEYIQIPKERNPPEFDLITIIDDPEPEQLEIIFDRNMQTRLRLNYKGSKSRPRSHSKTPQGFKRSELGGGSQK